jgi:hypothetical protein
MHSEDTILWTMLEHSLCDKLQCFNEKFYATAIQRLMQKWKNYVNNEDFVEN